MVERVDVRRLEADLDADFVTYSCPSIIHEFGVVFKILFEVLLAVITRGSLAASGSSLRHVLRVLVELYLAVLAHEGMRSLRLRRHIIGEVVVDLLRPLGMLRVPRGLFASSSTVRAD